MVALVVVLPVDTTVIPGGCTGHEDEEIVSVSICGIQSRVISSTASGSIV